MRRKNHHLDEGIARRSGWERSVDLTAALASAGISDARIKKEEAGCRVEIKK